MKLTVKRLADNGDATIGAFYMDGVFQCFTIEDEERETKVSGETRVPEGTYDVKLRASGGFHSRYKKKYASMHKGMLCIHNADNWKIETPNMSFQYILIHTGNTDDHTAGCLLLNDGVSGASFKGSSSVNAYSRIYPVIARALSQGESVSITYEDVEEGK
jgi:hypothetical protein